MLLELTEDASGAAFSFEQYLEPAVAKARPAFPDDTVTEFLDDVDNRITSRILRKALFSAAPITGADGTVSNGENDLLADIAVRFA